MQGLRAHRQQPADLVLCDIFMPEMEGMETIQELRNGSPAQPIVAMSGGAGRVSGKNVLQDALLFGATAVLATPFEPEQHEPEGIAGTGALGREIIGTRGAALR